MGLEQSGKIVGEDSAVKAARQAGAAGAAGNRESGRSRLAVLVLLALSFALGCTEFTIIGIEPALKPATEAPDHGRILVMATDITLSLDKYHELAETYGKGCEVISVPCPGLAGRIEHGDLEASDLVEMIRGYVGSFAGTVGSVVLGCTHYPFVRRQIAEVLGEGVKFYDGGAGTARQLRKRLADRGLLAPEGHTGAVEFASSKDTAAELELYREFFGYEL